ncbi:hypothetical protein C8J57DRAFT_1074307 [Mycena rebaudengoi]|nr:hypothetical protein C8J57DRAFT_1074307 [Mycena rebaudengoi]
MHACVLDSRPFVLKLIPRGYRWLYEEFGIMHRDFSLNKLMYRKVDGKVFGVSNDFDYWWTIALTRHRNRAPRTKPSWGWTSLCLDSILNRFSTFLCTSYVGIRKGRRSTIRLSTHGTISSRQFSAQRKGLAWQRP